MDNNTFSTYSNNQEPRINNNNFSKRKNNLFLRKDYKSREIIEAQIWIIILSLLIQITKNQELIIIISQKE
jgi:hypothetical protein